MKTAPSWPPTVLRQGTHWAVLQPKLTRHQLEGSYRSCSALGPKNTSRLLDHGYPQHRVLPHGHPDSWSPLLAGLLKSPKTEDLPSNFPSRRKEVTVKVDFYLPLEILEHWRHWNTEDTGTLKTLEYWRHWNAEDTGTLKTLEHWRHWNTEDTGTLKTLEHWRHWNTEDTGTLKTLEHWRHWSTEDIGALEDTGTLKTLEHWRHWNTEVQEDCREETIPKIRSRRITLKKAPEMGVWV